MTNARSYARSFAGGEVTPEFFARFDDSKNQTGLKTCRNAIVKPHGPVSNRGGLRFVRYTKTKGAARLLRFVYSSDQSVVVEMGVGYFRFHTLGATILQDDGVTIYELVHPYTANELADVKYVQSNDVLTLVHPNHPPAELKRLGANNWTYAPISFESNLTQPASVSATATTATSNAGTPSLQTYVITAVNGSDESPSSQLIPGVPSPVNTTNITGITKANPGVFSIGLTGMIPNVGAVIKITGVAGMTEVNGGSFSVTTRNPILDGDGNTTGYTMTLTNTTTNVLVDTSAYGAYVSGGTVQLISNGGSYTANGVATCSNNLFDDGAFNTIAWSAVTGAERYYVYKLENGLFGFCGQTQDLKFTDDNIAPDLSKTPPILDDPFVSAGNYPQAVTYFEQRRFFASTNNDPAYFWATRSGTESNLNFSIPTRADDSIRVRIAARERCEIRHLVPLTNLILLAESSEWRVTDAAGDGPLTPDVSIRPQSGIGSNQVSPVIVNNNILFASARGGHLRELGYSFNAGGFVTGDLCLRAPHLFDGLDIVDLAFAKAPLPIVWAVSSSGKLLGLTYVPEEQVGGWHHHDTDGGTFNAICVVPENGTDVLYCVINRDGSYTIERMEPRQTTDDALGFFVDAGLTYTGAPQTVFSGLDHLEGRKVVALADGAVIDGLTVSGGSVTLADAASTVHVGLAIVTDVETLPAAFQTGGFGQGRPKNANKVWLRVYSTRDIKAGPSFDKLREFKPRTTETYNQPPNLVTGEIEISLTPQWSADGQISIRHDLPLPFTLLSITPEHAVAG